MKRFLSSLVLVMFVAWMSGCERSSSTDQSGSEGTTVKPRIAVSIPAATHGWPAGVGWWAQQTIQQHPNVEWIFQRASSAAEQASQIEAMLERRIDALVVLPFDSDTPLPAIRRAKQRQVFVVSVDRGLREPVADIYLAGDNRAFGRKAAEYMVEKLGGKGNIVILRGMPVEIDNERYQAAMEVFNQHPGIRVLGAQPGNWNRTDAHRVMQNFLTQFPRIDAVWASDDDMALGVEQAIREAGRQEEMWILGGAGMKQIVKRVMDNDRMFPANVTYPPGMISAGIELAVAHLVDGDLTAAAARIPAHLGVTEEQLGVLAEQPADRQRNIKLDVHLITPENASQYYFPESVY